MILDDNWKILEKNYFIFFFFYSTYFLLHLLYFSENCVNSGEENQEKNSKIEFGDIKGDFVTNVFFPCFFGLFKNLFY